jgi:hypothetical protein
VVHDAAGTRRRMADAVSALLPELRYDLARLVAIPSTGYPSRDGRSSKCGCSWTT